MCFPSLVKIFMSVAFNSLAVVFLTIPFKVPEERVAIDEEVKF